METEHSKKFNDIKFYYSIHSTATRRANKNAAQKPPDAHPAGQSREKGLSPWKA